MLHAALTVQKHWRQVVSSRHLARVRLIHAEARRRHMQRATFQQRQREGLVHRSKDLTLWDLKQCHVILRESIDDVVQAARTSRRAQAMINSVRISAHKHLRDEVAERIARNRARALVRQTLQRQLPKLLAMNAIGKHIRQERAAESEWHSLLGPLANEPD